MLNGERGATLDHTLLQPGPFAFPPTLYAVHDAIAQRSPLSPTAALDGSRNAYELDLEPVAGRMHDAVAMPAEIQERHVWRQIGVASRAGRSDVSGPVIFQAGAHPLQHQHIDRRLSLPARGAIEKIQRAERMILRQTVFHALDEGRGRERAGDESNAHRLEGLGRQRFRRKTRKESVSISRHRDKTRDAVSLDEVVDFAALNKGIAEITQSEAGVTRTGPGLRETLG